VAVGVLEGKEHTDTNSHRLNVAVGVLRGKNTQTQFLLAKAAEKVSALSVYGW
jgi:hypothetical protein